MTRLELTELLKLNAYSHTIMSIIDRQLEIILKQRGRLLAKLNFNSRSKSKNRRRSIIIPRHNDELDRDDFIEIIIPEGALCIILTSVFFLISGLNIQFQINESKISYSVLILHVNTLLIVV